MAADGQLYPPERHPDYRPPAIPPPVGPPAFAGSGPASPSTSANEPVAVVRVTKKHLLVTAAIAATIGAVLGGYFWINRLPSVGEDKAHLESALPSGSDLPPGLTGIDPGGSRSGNAFCEQASHGPGERSSAMVGYKATALGETGLYVGVAAYESPDDASRAFVTAPSAMRCGTGKLDLIPVTGGVREAEESQTYTAGPAYVTVARRDRFLVIGVGGTARDALKWTKFAITRL